MDVINLFLSIASFIAIIALFYGILTGKLDKTDIAGILLILISVIGVILIFNIAETFSLSIQKQYYIDKVFIESMNISEKDIILPYMQQIFLSSQEALYNLKVFFTALFIGFIILGLLILIGKRLIPKIQ